MRILIKSLIGIAICILVGATFTAFASIGLHSEAFWPNYLIVTILWSAIMIWHSMKIERKAKMRYVRGRWRLGIMN